MSKVIKITQCQWCGRVLSKKGEWVDLDLPIFYVGFVVEKIESETSDRNGFPKLHFELVSCTDCETKEADVSESSDHLEKV